MTICSNCGSEVGESKFCPNCGSKIENQKQQDDLKFCPNCGQPLDSSSKFCPNCGNNSQSNDTVDNETNSVIDNIVDVDDKISHSLSNLMNKSKIIGKASDYAGNRLFKDGNEFLDGATRKYLEVSEPAFLEVYDTIEDIYIKNLFLLEKNRLGRFIPPTAKLSKEKAVEFYQEMLDEAIAKLNEERQKDSFDGTEYLTMKFKEANTANSTNIFIPNSLKSMHKIGKRK